mgnify:CR=1 FL=1
MPDDDGYIGKQQPKAGFNICKASSRSDTRDEGDNAFTISQDNLLLLHSLAISSRPIE